MMPNVRVTEKRTTGVTPPQNSLDEMKRVRWMEALVR